MGTIRAFLLQHRAMAFAVVALALAMKALVPAGYMIGTQSKVLTILVCNETPNATHESARDIVVPVKGDGAGKQARADGTCPFSGLGFAGLPGTDPIQLALALAFILATGFVAVKPAAPTRAQHLRPPLRGPPALI